MGESIEFVNVLLTASKPRAGESSSKGASAARNR